MKTRIYIFLVLLLTSQFAFESILYSQQISLFNNNIVNPYSVNPATAGIVDNQMFFQHRRELVGIQGAPEVSLLSAEFRLDKSKSAVGFKVMHEQANIIRNTVGYMTYATHLKLTKTQFLSFGLSLGVRFNGLRFDQVNALEIGDNILFNSNQSNTSFDGNFGIKYQFNNLEIQTVALQLFGNKANYENSFEQKELNYSFVRHFYASIGYQLFKDKKIKIKPQIQARGAQGLPFLPEAIVRFDYKNFAWLAGHYRNDAAWAISAGTTITERFIIGYSAEFSTNQLSKHNSGTHEIIFGIKLSTPQKALVNPSRINKIEKNSRIYEERMEYLNQQNKKLEEETNKLREKLKEIENSSEKIDYESIKRLIEEEANKNNKNSDSEKEKLIKKEIEQYSQSIHFQTGSDKISKSSLSYLDQIVGILNENKNAKIIVSGHTDTQGSRSNNETLSLKRANAVKNYLVSKGINEDRIKTFGYGYSKPITPNNSAEGRERNRRVEIEIKF